MNRLLSAAGWLTRRKMPHPCNVTFRLPMVVRRSKLTMIHIEFHKSEKGRGDEDWYSLRIDPNEGQMAVRHTWSHSSGGATFLSGEKLYSLEEFARLKPNQYRWLLEWLTSKLTPK